MGRKSKLSASEKKEVVLKLLRQQGMAAVLARRYGVTVIDDDSRCLPAARLTFRYCVREVIAALKDTRAEAERLCGPLTKPPFLVTDEGSSLIARRFGE